MFVDIEDQKLAEMSDARGWVVGRERTLDELHQEIGPSISR